MSVEKETLTMKTIQRVRKLSVTILVLSMVAGLTACGGSAEETSSCAGGYIAVAGEIMGMSLTEKELAGYFLNLKASGEGTLETGDDSVPIQWSETDGKLTVETKEQTIEGSLGENIAVFEDFMNLGITLTMAKVGSEEAIAGHLAENEQAVVGTWHSFEIHDILDHDASGQFAPNGLTIAFHANHTVDITLNGETLPPQQWSNLESWGSLYDSDYAFSWELFEGVLRVNTSLDGVYASYLCARG